MIQTINLEESIKSIQKNIETEGYTKRNLIDQYHALYRVFVEMEYKTNHITSETEGEVKESALNVLYEAIVLSNQLKFDFYKLYKKCEEYGTYYFFSDDDFIIELGVSLHEYLNEQANTKDIENRLCDFIFRIDEKIYFLNKKLKKLNK